jgi:DNA polymerase
MSSSTEPRDELAQIAASLRAYLEWQRDTGAMGIPRKPRGAGATASATAEAGIAASSPVAPPVAPPEPPVAPPEPLEPVAKAPLQATARASATKTAAPARPLPVLAEVVASCTRCALAETRKSVVFARGNPEAKLCFIGEAPGADEDEQGVPFVGRAGQLLDKMIAAMGLDPASDVYVCNIVKCRPPANRTPEPDEIEACLPYLHEQLENVRPDVIVALGNTAVAALLGSKLGITKMRGSWKLYKGRVPVMPTYHPSYLLRPGPTQADAKKQAWEDLQAVMKNLGLAAPKKK